MRWLGFVLLLSIPLSAQTATPSSKFVIDQLAPDLQTANSYTYKLYADGATTGTVIVMTCTGLTSPFTCTTPIGPFTPGPHSVTVTASNVAGESGKATAVGFSLVVVPAIPLNLRIS